MKLYSMEKRYLRTNCCNRKKEMNGKQKRKHKWYGYTIQHGRGEEEEEEGDENSCFSIAIKSIRDHWYEGGR